MSRAEALRKQLVLARLEERVDLILRGEHQILTLEELRILAHAYRARSTPVRPS